MGFFRKLLGMESAAEIETEANGLFEKGEFGLAKLRYENVLDKLGAEASDADRERVKGRITAARNAIADQRLVEGERLLVHGRPDLAEHEVRGALEVAVDEALLARGDELLTRIEAYEAYAQEQDPADLSDEDRLALITGEYTDDQQIEYAELGDEAFDAALELHKGHFVRARELLEGLVETADSPRWLYRDLARARLHVGDTEGAEQAYREFLERVGADITPEARLEAHVERVRLLDARGDFEGAMAELERAIDSAGDDPRPFITLGQYLRLQGHPREAIEVQRVAQRLTGERVDWLILQELGLCLLDAGDEAGGQQVLEEVEKLFTAQGRFDLPVDTGVALAKLHERHGRFERAADLYRLLSRGSDAARRPVYCSEAARLLVECGLPDEARKMLRQAISLVADDADAKASLEARLASLEAD